MIRSLIRTLAVICFCSAIYYYFQWQSLDVLTQQRITRLIGYIPVVLVSLMATYVVLAVGMAAFGVARAVIQSRPKRCSAQPVQPTQPLITIIEEGVQS